MFYIDKNKDISFSDLEYYIGGFNTSYLPRLTKLYNYYKNENKIKYRVFEDKSKPNNKISHSFANYIVSTNTSMLLGNPVTYQSDDDLQDFLNILENANEEDINIDLATNLGIYGYAIQLVYLDENAEIKFSVFDNKQTILIYDNNIELNLLYVVRVWEVNKIDFSTDKYIEVYSKDSIKRYRNSILISEDKNIFDDIPIIVYKNNTQCTSDFEYVIDLIDEYDLITSDTANEQDYFNNCYMYLNTDDVEPDDIAQMKENRVIYGENLNPQFILKQSNNTDLENEKNRVVKDIHKLSFVPDLSDENFANNVSGVAMKYKLFGTLNNIANKQRKFKKGIQDRNKLIFNIMYIKSLGVPSYINVIFTSNLPQNILDTAQTINLLRGLVSDETLLAQLPFINDIAKEVESVSKNTSVSDIYGSEE